MRALLFFLTFFGILYVQGQRLYDKELGIEGARFTGLFPLADGERLGVGFIDSDHLMVRWDANGDTLWTQRQSDLLSLPWQNYLGGGALGNGSFLLGDYVFDQQGDVLDTIAIAGVKFEIGADSLICIGTDSLRLLDVEGNVAWAAGRFLPLVPLNPYFQSFGCRVGPYITLCTAYSNTQTNAGIMVHRYTLEGALVDSVTIRSAFGFITWTHGFIHTSDGGACTVATMANTFTCLIRFDQNGEMIWVRWFGEGTSDTGLPDLVGCSALTAAPDGGVVLAGTTRSINAPTFNLDLLHVDALGSPICRETVRESEAVGSFYYELAMGAENKIDLLHMHHDGLNQPGPYTLTGWNLAGFCAPEFGGAQELLALPDGGGVWVTSAEGSVQLKHWAADGTVQWTRIHDGPPVRSALVAPNGDILVVGDQESRWFDPTGDLLSVFTTEGGDCSWIGADSILVTTAERIKLMDPSGEIIWDHAITMEDGCSSTALSRGLRSGSRLLVLSECSVAGASRTFLSTYDLNGEPQGSMMVRESAASTLAPQALLSAGTEAIAVSSSVLDGSTLVFRCGATADTLWSHWFPNGIDEQGAAATAAAISGEGNILLGARTATGTDLLGLDAFGGSPCLETIIPEAVDPTFAMVLDVNGLLWAGYASEGESVPLQHLSATDPGTFCSSADIAASYGASACGQPRFDGLTWTVGGTDCRATLEYVIMDASGRAVHEGTLRTGTDHLPLLAGPGLYLMRAVDRANGEAFTVRLIQP